MKLIVGLGNPGPRYTKTRHNLGCRVVETLARNLRARWKQDKNLKSRFTEIECQNQQGVLAVPESFMNESGKPLELLLRHFEINFKNDLLVVVDDAALPFGRLRLRAEGSDGGHKGLRSIQEVLRSSGYARLRVGIRPPEPVREPLEEYVLRPFTPKEEKKLKEVLDRAARACQLWISKPVAEAMNWTNPPPEVP